MSTKKIRKYDSIVKFEEKQIFCSNNVVICKIRWKLVVTKPQEVFRALGIPNSRITYRGFTQGRATCSPEDTYDLSVGAELAEKRAKIKIYNQALKVCTRVANEYRNCASSLDYMVQSCAGNSSDLSRSLFSGEVSKD